MSETSRRKFIAAAGVTAAAAGTVGVTAGGARAAVPSSKRAQEPVVVLVEDHRSDKVSLLVGEREIVVHDHDLATRILNAAGGK